MPLFRTYGTAGTIKTLRNMNRVQRRLLPQRATLTFAARSPTLNIPVHFIFGAHDSFAPPEVINESQAMMAGSEYTLTQMLAGHMAHFDQPATVRGLLANALPGEKRVRVKFRASIRNHLA